MRTIFRRDSCVMQDWITKIHIFFFFFILNAKIYNNILPITLPTKLLYDTTKTLPGGAICHDYPLAFNINLKKGEKKIHLYIPLNTKC